MEDTFDIPVTYKGKDLTFPSTLLVFGYTYKISVEVNGTEVLYEPDEERNYRAVIDPEKMEGMKRIDKELLKAIAGAINQFLNRIVVKNVFFCQSTLVRVVEESRHITVSFSL